MDDARKLLDSLMGPSRDKSKEEQQRADGWKDRNVCKRFLVGFCPNDCEDNWFKNTRRDPGTCNKVHSERLKKQFQEHPDRPKYEAEYEKDFLIFLEGLVFEADAWIGREKGNCKPAGKVTRIPPNVNQNMVALQEQAEKLMADAEDLAEKGELVSSKEAVRRADELRKDMEATREKYTFMSVGEEVCEVCGVRCNPDDQEHYRAHFDGKLHEGYTRVRQTVKDLREKLKQTPPPKRDEAADRERRRDGGRERAEEKGRDRSRDRGRERPRDRSRERDREREGGKERGRRDRDRDRDRERQRGRG